ncbi:Ca2+/H+ antiporter [Cordyceps fumosorosea ARSEF 2679]|uniref:Vacuolar calcium ion transporter n=1 Tax=Cordyceps fumosorosea (strain ARSEF 2679) TaxID=1081104 RepID=A0A162JHH0_CORFA|nr:Ca2+/H+ antiporter [Cordyceps fumosorosea ARSEF 2679]OAA69042.1 Ca2+/H+ antiporter [Cordyceps fumosorosea ARSEF 2679]
MSNDAAEMDHGPGLPTPSTHSDDREKGQMLRVKPQGESGRSGVHPWHFIRISFKSACKASTLCSVLWPVVPAALAVRYALSNHHILIFVLSYIAIVPCASLIGFASQEFARKVPHVAGIIVDATCGSVVELVLFLVFLQSDNPNNFYIIKAAIMGSILATMLLCLGVVFLAGGLKREEQTFSDAISEAGSGLLLMAGVVLSVPTVFRQGLAGMGIPTDQLESATLHISHIISVLLIIAYLIYTYFQARTHHGIYDAIFEDDEQREASSRRKPNAEDMLTMTECLIALAISISLVTLLTIGLVGQIEHVIEDTHVSDAFMGLILVPLVEKFAEHITAVDEARGDRMNFALSHVLGSTLQTALFTAPLTVVVGWALQKPMDLIFDIFPVVMLILSILTVGKVLQDQKSNYLEGMLLLILYLSIAVSAFYYPFTGPVHGKAGGEAGGEPHRA